MIASRAGAVAAAASIVAAGSAAAQPVWSLDVLGAEQGLSLTTQCRAFNIDDNLGNCLGTPIDLTASGSQNTLVPGYTLGMVVYDYGRDSQSAAAASGHGVMSAGAASVVGIRGLGTGTVEVYLRAAVLNDASLCTCGFIGESAAGAVTSFPLTVAGVAPGVAYTVSYSCELFVNAVTAWENIPPDPPEDASLASCRVRLLAPGVLTTVTDGQYSSVPPDPPGTGGTQMLTGTVEALPGGPGQPALLSADLVAGASNNVAPSTNVPMPEANDLGGGEVVCRLTLTIGAAAPQGACCINGGAFCFITTQRACAGGVLPGAYLGSGTACPPPGVNCCPADFNNSGALTVQDIFDFLAAYFGGDPRADFNGSGAITVQDIFDFLAAYFEGCA